MRKIFLYIKNMRIYDKALLIYMLILFFRIAHSLFTTAPGTESNAINIIVRTNAAAIFGYFIGGGFLCRDTENGKCTGEISKKYIVQQIAIVFTIGFFSLLLLVFGADFAEKSKEATASISQLRDFVCSSVGLLIGHSVK